MQNSRNSQISRQRSNQTYRQGNDQMHKQTGGSGSRQVTVQTERRRQIRKRKQRIQKLKKAVVILIFLFSICGICFCVFMGKKDREAGSENVSGSLKTQGLWTYEYEKHPKWQEDFLTENDYSRPGIPLRDVNNIFVHYTANPGTSAKQNRDYFNNLGTTKERFASAHFIIGYEGEIIQCVPLDEIAYAVKGRNQDSISIECCHLTEDGAFTEETYQSLIRLLDWLVDVYDLEAEDILRHYDSNGKLCPLYYVEHEEEWRKLKEEVEHFTM